MVSNKSSKLNCRVFEISSTKTEIRDSGLPQNCMKFDFLVEVKRFINGTTTQPMEQFALSATYTSAEQLFDNSTTMSEIRESLSGPLISLYLLEQEHSILFQYVCDAARKSVRGLEKGYVNVNLEFKVLLEHHHHEHYPMLKKYDVGAASKNSDQESCSICLNDLFRHGGDEEVMCTPCDHVFHGDCIKKWLDKRSSCPLCRCELGTS